MRENDLNAHRRRKYIPTTDSSNRRSAHSFPVCENILNREFYAEKQGEKWVSDITYLRTLNGWIYFTVVIDLFDRSNLWFAVIGWALGTNLDAANNQFLHLKWLLKTVLRKMICSFIPTAEFSIARRHFVTLCVIIVPVSDRA